MEEKIEKFTIFKNTYKLLRHLPEKNKIELYDAMFDYMFEGIEPSFDDELSDGIWVNLVMILDNTKSRILNGKKGGRNSDTNELGYEKQEPNYEPNIEPNSKPNYEPNIEPNPEPNPKPKPQANTVFLISNFFISNFNYLDISNKEKLKEKILEWNKYKIEKKKKYTETGINNLLKQIDKHVKEYGLNVVIDLIDECMASNYQGIIFDKLKEKSPARKSIAEKNAEVLAKERERIRREKELNEQRGSS